MVRPLDVFVAEDLLQSPDDEHFLRFGADGGTAGATGNNAATATVAATNDRAVGYRWHNFAPKLPIRAAATRFK